MNSYCSEGMWAVRSDLRQPTQNYLRAVLRPTPSHYTVEPFVDVGKSKGKYHHGIHISSIHGISPKHTSISSRGSLSEYDIWRSWDDWLWFQQSLEAEYEVAAREKKTRLTQGKGVKGFNGLYKKDLASSWESLPPGPDPNSVAQDIHVHLPSLTRRGTLFRASQATIDQRQAELIALIEALFSNDMPALVKEIRESNIVSDFFGYWRRDHEFAEACQTTKTIPRTSLTNSMFSSYFSASHPSLPSSDTSPRNSPPKVPSKRSQLSTTPRPLSFISSNGISEEPRYPYESPRRSRPRPNSVSSDSSAHSDSSDASFTSSVGPAIVDDVPIVFGYDPLNPSDRSSSILEVLPEEDGILSKSPEPYRQVKPKSRASATERKTNRSFSILGLSLKKGLLPAEKSGNPSVRESWQTTDSQDSTANDLLDGLGLILPHQIKEQKFRNSIASISTFMTTDSANAVIPQRSRTPTSSLTPGARISPLSLSDLDTSDDNYSILDEFPRPISSIPAVRHESRTETPVDDFYLPDSPSSTRTVFNPPASPTCSSSMLSEISSWSFPVDSVSIKAIHNSAIILLRVSRGIGLADVRQRLYNKFICQEGLALSQAFNMAFVPPNPARVAGASAQLPSVTSGNRMDDQLLTSESDWQQLMTNPQSSKITVRILDISTV